MAGFGGTIPVLLFPMHIDSGLACVHRSPAMEFSEKVTIDIEDAVPSRWYHAVRCKGLIAEKLYSYWESC